MNEPSMVRSATVCELVAVNKSSRTLTHTITTSGVNLNGHSVIQGGGEMDEFLKGGVVLFGHDDSRPAIGKNIGLLPERDRWVADTEFADTQFGNELLYLYANKFMKAWSIGFRPLETEYVKGKDGNIDHVVFPKWKLKEYSAVNIGANVDALTHALNTKLITAATHGLLLGTPDQKGQQAAPSPQRDAPDFSPVLQDVMELGLEVRTSLIRALVE